MGLEENGDGPSRRLGRSFGRLLVEMGMIVFSILLALSVNEWRDHRANRELAGLCSGQDWLKRLEDRLLGSITSDQADRLRPVRGLESSLRNYIDMEGSLQKAYDQELSRLGGGTAGRAAPSGPQG